MKVLIFLIALLLSASVSATGMWFDPDEDGEGVNVFHKDTAFENTMAFTVFTYTKRCNITRFDGEGELFAELLDELQSREFEEGDPLVGLTDQLSEYNHCRKLQSWFVAGRRAFTSDGAFGDLYITDPFESSGNPIAEPRSVGLFTLEFFEDGYILEVRPSGDALDPDADIYAGKDFSEFLYGPDRPQAPD